MSVVDHDFGSNRRRSVVAPLRAEFGSGRHGYSVVFGSNEVAPWTRNVDDRDWWKSYFDLLLLHSFSLNLLLTSTPFKTVTSYLPQMGGFH